MIEHYPKSTATRDALAVMVEGYLGLDMRGRAQSVLKTLIANDPDNAQLDGNTFEPKHVKVNPPLTANG